MFSTRVLQTVSLVSRLDSRIFIRLGALRYVTVMLLRRWAWLILSNPVTSSRIRPLSAKREIARKFYRAGIVPPSGVGLDHPTWKEVRFDHILMILVCHCISLIAQLIFTLLFIYIVDKWFFKCCGFFLSPLYGFTPQIIDIFFVVLHFFGLHGVDKTR